MKELKPLQTMRGATLIVALIMLALIAIIGFGALQTTTMEEKMAGNLRDKNMSLQAAEAGLRDREAWLRGLSSPPPTTSWLVQSGGLDLSLSFPFGAAAKEYGEAGVIDINGVSADPKMVMEQMEFVPDSLDYNEVRGRDFYRIFSYGSGQTASSVTLLESTYAKRFN